MVMVSTETQNIIVASFALMIQQSAYAPSQAFQATILSDSNVSPEVAFICQGIAYSGALICVWLAPFAIRYMGYRHSLSLSSSLLIPVFLSMIWINRWFIYSSALLTALSGSIAYIVTPAIVVKNSSPANLQRNLALSNFIYMAYGLPGNIVDYFYLGKETVIDSRTRIVMYTIFCGLAVMATLVSHFGISDISGSLLPGMDSRSLHISFSESSVANPPRCPGTINDDTTEPLLGDDNDDGVFMANSISNPRRTSTISDNDLPSWGEVKSWLSDPKMVSLSLLSAYNGYRSVIISMVLPTVVSNSFKYRGFVPLTGILSAIGQMCGSLIIGLTGSRISNHSWMVVVFLLQTYLNFTTFLFFGEYANTSNYGPYYANPSLGIAASGAFLYGVIDNIAQVIAATYIVKLFKENATIGFTIYTCITGIVGGMFLFLNAQLNCWVQTGLNQAALFIASVMMFLVLDPW